MRYFLNLSYKGTNYHGWQRQPDVISVQETLETVLERRFGEFIHVMGCGRTDAGVHAKQFYAHVDLPREPDQQTIYQLNKMLPNDIAVFKAIPVASTANAQLDAVERTYEYCIHFNKNPYLEEWSTYYDKEVLDLDLMHPAISLLTSYDNYEAFCLTPTAYKHTRCVVREAVLQIREGVGSQLCFRITANRFLRGMIRLLVGRLLEVGRGAISLEEFTGYLRDQNELKHRVPAAACGLHLVGVRYENTDVIEQTNLQNTKA